MFEWADEMEAALKVPEDDVKNAGQVFDKSAFAFGLREKWPYAVWAASWIPIFFNTWWRLVPALLVTGWVIGRAKILENSRDCFVDGFTCGYQARVRREMNISDDTMKYLHERKTMLGQMAEKMARGKETAE